MRYRLLGDTGIRVSEIGVGCGGLGGEKKMGLEPVIEHALDLGINFFDTCDTYAESRSEQTLGRVLGRRRRDEFVICTKFGGVIDAQGEWRRDISIPHLHRAFEASCRRLQVEHLDVYLVHTPPQDLDREQALFTELDAMVKAGKIRAYGVSTETGSFATAIGQASRAKSVELAFNLFRQEPRAAFLDYARAQGMGIVCKSPMANGVLTDSFDPDNPTDAQRYFRKFGAERFQRRAELVRQVRPILKRDGRTMAQGALAWLLAFPEVSTVIPGIQSLARLEETAAVTDMRLAPDDLAELDAIGTLKNGIVI